VRVHAEPLTAGGQRYLIVYNHQDRPTQAKVVLPTSKARVAYDVFAHRQLAVKADADGATLTVKLGRYDGVLLALCEEPLPQITATGRNASAGQDAVVQIAAGAKGVVPVAVTVLDPGGRKTVYGGSFAVTDGTSRYVIPTGVNDPAGLWRVEVEDLVTGKKATTTLQLRGHTK
jgi:hypothetical protein